MSTLRSVIDQMAAVGNDQLTTRELTADRRAPRMPADFRCASHDADQWFVGAQRARGVRISVSDRVSEGPGSDVGRSRSRDRGHGER